MSSNCYFECSDINLSKFRNKLNIHNYSPRPKDPFVLNLASQDKETISKSIKMIESNINLSSSLCSKYYSLHAGYASDIKPEMLGKKITSQSYDCRKNTYDLFKERCKLISKKALKKGVRILIENNVVGKKNMDSGKSGLLFLSEIDEIYSFSVEMQKYCGLLLDVGHLKVSARNYKFDLEKAILKIAPYVEGIHLSDNNGEEDTNEYIEKDFWFLPYFKLFTSLKYIGLETKPASNAKIIDMYSLIKSSI